MENIIMTEGIASQFKGKLQKSYDYLDSCNRAIQNCKLLNELGIENNNAELKEEVNIQKGDITQLLNSVKMCEEIFINLDNTHGSDLEALLDDDKNKDTAKGSTKVTTETKETTTLALENDKTVKDLTDTVLTDQSKKVDTDQESRSTIENDATSLSKITGTINTKKDTESTSGGSSYSTSNSYSNDYSTSGNPTKSYQIPINPPSNNNTSINQNYYEFSTDINDMTKAGDPFANTPYSMTYYTNFLLYKYDIKDKDIAQKIYEALINYGKLYSKNNSGINPLLKQDEELIIKGIYNILKEENNFDINKYAIFKNIGDK